MDVQSTSRTQLAFPRRPETLDARNGGGGQRPLLAGTGANQPTVHQFCLGVNGREGVAIAVALDIASRDILLLHS